MMQQDPAGPVRPRRHPEPPDGRLRGRAHRAHRHPGLRAGLRHRRAGRAGPVARSPTSGPDLGQGYIVDAFMVVVLGGVGPARRRGVRRAGPGHGQQVPRRLGRRGGGQDHWCWSSSSSSSRSVRRASSPSRAASPKLRTSHHAQRPSSSPACPALAPRRWIALADLRRRGPGPAVPVAAPAGARGQPASTSPPTPSALLGKIMCYAIVRGGDGPDLGLRRHPVAWATACSSRSAATPWACT